MKKLFKSLSIPELVILAIGLLILLSFLYSIIRPMYLWDPGIDYLTKYDYRNPVYRFYSIESERSKYSIHEPIHLEVRFGFLKSSYVEGMDHDSLHIAITSEGSTPAFTYTLDRDAEIKLTDGQFSVSDLFCRFNKWLNQVPESDLPLEFEADLVFLENAPESGEIYIKIFFDDMPVLPYATLFYYRSGSRIYLSDKSVADAMSRGTVIS